MSNNQGFKEATLIQTGRRGGVAEMGRKACRHSVVQRGGGPTLICGIKIRRDTLGVSYPSPRADHTAQASSTRKINPHNF